MSLFSPLSCTAERFSEELFLKVGRGREQAAKLYSQFIRTGRLSAQIPCFANAPSLYQEMIDLLDLSHDVVGPVREGGGVIKFVLQTSDGYGIESVVMMMQHRKTLCLSSQIGCGVGCRFCKTGQSGFIRNLSEREITQQLFVAKHCLGQNVQNIVFMGMGEPFSNMKNVLSSIEILTDSLGFGIGMRRITIATSGDVEKIRMFSRLPFPCPNLAVSLNAPNDELRSFLMPGRTADNLHSLRDALEEYCSFRKKEILVSYVLIRGVNDSLLMAEDVAQFLKGLPVRINVIPVNPDGASQFIAPTEKNMSEFVCYLRGRGYAVFLRKTRGDILEAGCGQLAQNRLLA